ncbi:MAG: ankyrin repeat domain-containing protein [Lentimicrobiaceae bacterium]|nr:ankyrin repeat domain-containing protein [Lentimicrobiaceae bacterium]
MKKLSGFLGLVLSAGIVVSCATFSSLPPLHIAAQKGNFNKVQQLVESGVDINERSFGDTALELAALRGRLEVVEYLLSKGARDPERAFRNALRNNYATIVRLMVDGGHIDVNYNALAFYEILNDRQLPFDQRLHNVKKIAGDTLNSPLLLVLVDAENYQQTIEFFNINLEDRVDALGNSILHVAAMRNNLDLATYLLERNFDVNALNDNHHTALFYNVTSFGPSINWNSPVIEDETKARIHYIGDMPFYSNPLGVRMRRAQIGLMLLDAGINVNQQDLSGWTVLHFAGASSYAGGASTMEFFIERGADQGLETNLGRTAEDILAMRDGK